MTPSRTIKYRTMVPNDETGVLAVFAEVAAEIPVALDNRHAVQTIIVQCRASGHSWVATDVDGKIVGFALAKPDLREPGALSLRYIGVSKNSRGLGISGDLIAKLKARGAPLTANVLHDNRSNMAARLRKSRFTKTGTSESESQFRCKSDQPGV